MRKKGGRRKGRRGRERGRERERGNKDEREEEEMEKQIYLGSGEPSRPLRSTLTRGFEIPQGLRT